jgi:hypothetical protein
MNGYSSSSFSPAITIPGQCGYRSSSSPSSSWSKSRRGRRRRRPVLSLVLMMPLASLALWWRPYGTTHNNNNIVAMASPCVPVEPQPQQQDDDNDNCVCQVEDEALVQLDFAVGRTDLDLDWKIEDVTNQNYIVMTSCNDLTPSGQCEIGYYDKTRQRYCLPKDRCYRLVVQSLQRSAVITGSFDGIVFLEEERADETLSVYINGGSDNNSSHSSSGVCMDQRPSLPWASDDGNDGHWLRTILIVLVGLGVGYCCLGRLMTWCWCDIQQQRPEQQQQ